MSSMHNSRKDAERQRKDISHEAQRRKEELNTSSFAARNLVENLFFSPALQEAGFLSVVSVPPCEIYCQRDFFQYNKKEYDHELR